ncbi:MAG: response regulator [Flavobacteriales bacterium]|nr:response regulator [Flavobacteriales bacterium]
MPKNILVVDDSATIQKVVEIIFAHERDVRLWKAANGNEAVAVTQQVKPDAILMDAVLPGASGYDVAAHLKQDPALAAAPLFMLACTSEPFDEARARAAGAAGFLQKPFDSTTCLERVLGALGVTPITLPARARHARRRRSAPAGPASTGCAAGHGRRTAARPARVWSAAGAPARASSRRPRAAPPVGRGARRPAAGRWSAAGPSFHQCVAHHGRAPVQHGATAPAATSCSIRPAVRVGSHRRWASGRTSGAACVWRTRHRQWRTSRRGRRLATIAASGASRAAASHGCTSGIWCPGHRRWRPPPRKRPPGFCAGWLSHRWLCSVWGAGTGDAPTAGATSSGAAAPRRGSAGAAQEGPVWAVPGAG